MAENVKILAAKFGLERLGLLTLTFKDFVTCIKEAQKRFNSLRTGVLAERYAASIAVVERMKSGRIHFHLLIVCPQDIRTGMDFLAIGRGDYRSANAWLRAEWAFWRRTSPRYRFGRTELLPVKSTVEAMACYVGKYIAKHIGSRVADDKGARLVRYTVNARAVGTRFAWAGVRPWLWRAKLARFAAEQGCADLADVREKFGKRWAYELSEYIMGGELHSYPSLRHAAADGRFVEEEDLNLPGAVEMAGGAPVVVPPPSRAFRDRVDAAIRRIDAKRADPASYETTTVWADANFVRVGGGDG